MMKIGKLFGFDMVVDDSMPEGDVLLMGPQKIELDVRYEDGVLMATAKHEKDEPALRAWIARVLAAPPDTGREREHGE